MNSNFLPPKEKKPKITIQDSYLSKFFPDAENMDNNLIGKKVERNFQKSDVIKKEPIYNIKPPNNQII